jgi:hypothetical protein
MNRSLIQGRAQFPRTAAVSELRNSLERRFLVRVWPHSNGTPFKRKSEIPQELR